MCISRRSTASVASRRACSAALTRVSARHFSSGPIAVFTLRATEKARGSLTPLPDGTDRRGRIPGTPDLARMSAHRPLDNADRVRAATLIMDAADDQYFDPKANGEAVYNAIRDNAPASYQLFPGDHYAPYGAYFEDAMLLTLDWFQTHLAAAE